VPSAGAAAAGLPKYRQLAAQLAELIETGALPPGSLMPSEAETTDRYGVSQPTVRAAMRELRSQGLIVTYHGRGSFVRHSDDRPARTLNRAVTRDRTGGTFAPDLDPETWTEAEKPSTYQLNATAELALALGLAEHAPVFVCDRLYTDHAGRRISHRLYLPFDTCHDIPALTDDPFRHPAELYPILAQAGHTLSWEEYVRASAPTPDDTNTLHIPDGAPMLLIRRYTRDSHDATTLAMEETRLPAHDTHPSAHECGCAG